LAITALAGGLVILGLTAASAGVYDAVAEKTELPVSIGQFSTRSSPYARPLPISFSTGSPSSVGRSG